MASYTSFNKCIISAVHAAAPKGLALEDIDRKLSSVLSAEIGRWTRAAGNEGKLRFTAAGAKTSLGVEYKAPVDPEGKTPLLHRIRLISGEFDSWHAKVDGNANLPVPAWIVQGLLPFVREMKPDPAVAAFAEATAVPAQ